MPKNRKDDKTYLLHKAAKEGNRKEVKRLLAADEDVNMLDAEGQTPLICAVDGGNEEVITDLLAAKANVNAASKIRVFPGMTALHSSVLVDRPEFIGVLVDSGAEINQPDGIGRTPLHFAALYERPAVARKLVEHRANINLRDNDGATPLHLAAQEDNFTIADILIEKGADPDAVDNEANTPLHYAAWHGSGRVAASLIEARANVGKGNKEEHSPLYLAQLKGRDAIADMLIDVDGGLRDLLVAPDPKSRRVSERVYDRARASTVRISVGANGNHQFSGSGVIISRGIVATNLHVIGDAREIIIRTAEDDRLYEVKLCAHNRDKDICLLDVKGLKAPKDPIKIRKYASLRVGEDVYAVGNPGDLTWSLSAGVISQKRDDGHGRREIQMDAAISGGSSGGGLFDRKGNLVGITKESVTEGNAQNLNFAIPADWLLGYFA